MGETIYTFKSTIFILTPTLLLILGVLTRVESASEIVTSLNRNCGKQDLVPTDIRSFAPWTVAIFRRVGNSTNHRWKFHTTGTIFTPRLVRSTQAGPVGRFPTDKDPRNFLIVAGVNTSDFTKHDQFAQYSRVSFIQSLESKVILFESFYHEALYHLETPLSFSTPFVKALCIPYFIVNSNNQYLKGLRSAQKDGVPIPFISYGFASGRRRKTMWRHGNRTEIVYTGGREWTLKVWKMGILPVDVCASILRFYYGLSLRPLCFKKTFSNATSFFTGDTIFKQLRLPPEYSHHDDDLCFAQGSRLTTFIGDTWYSGSSTNVIPGRKWKKCGVNLVYVSSISTNDASKYALITKFWSKVGACGEGKFPCASLNSSQCIPLNQTCDKNPDCDDKSDENPHNCAWKLSRQKEIKEVEPVQLRVSYDIDPRDGTLRCPDFEFPLEGIRCIDPENLQEVDCTSHFYAGRRIRVECAKFHVAPKYSYDHLDLFCNFERAWVGLRPIYCQKECGSFDEKKSNQTKNFPWDITIFENGAEICGGTLIQPTIILTDGTCVKKWIEEPETRSAVQISIAGGNSGQLQIKNSWVSTKNSGDSEDSLKYEDEIALIQLSNPVEQNMQDLHMVMTTCLPVPPFTKIHSEQSAVIGTGKFVVISGEKCEAGLKNGGFCTISPLNPGALKIGAGLFLHSVETSTGIPKHVLQGIFSGATKDGRGIFKNVNSHANWIVDILETNS